MKTAICAIVKDEHRYLKEWIDYHLKLGFDEIWIGEDYGSKSHQPIVSEFDKERVHIIKIVEFLPNHYVTLGAGSRQVTFYNKFFKENKHRFDWIANIDIDEFVVVENESLKDFLVDFQEYEGVCLAWKYFGACGNIKAPKGNLVDTFTMPCHQPVADYQVKSIVNCKKADKVLFMHAATHNCVNTHKEFDFKKSLNGFYYAREFHWYRAWINHYFTRSWEEWVKRMIRGNMHNSDRTLDTFFIFNEDMNDIKKELIFEAYKKSSQFYETDVYSREFSLYSEPYKRELKDDFFKRIGR